MAKDVTVYDSVLHTSITTNPHAAQHDLMACSHRRPDETRQFCLVCIGGVNKPLDIT